MPYVPLFSSYFNSVGLSTDTDPTATQKLFKLWAEKYHSGLPSLPELDWVTRNDDRKLITSSEFTSIQTAYKSACVTAFGYFLGFGATGLYFSRNLWKHWAPPVRIALVTATVAAPFYYIPIVRTDRALLRELSTHDTWLGREIKSRTPQGFWAPEEKAEAKKLAKEKKKEAVKYGFQPAKKAEAEKTPAAPVAPVAAGHGHAPAHH